MKYKWEMSTMTETLQNIGQRVSTLKNYDHYVSFENENFELSRE